MRLLRAAMLGTGLLLLPALAGPTLAQVESREGIALQNQILQLRQEIEALRRGGSLPAPAPSGGGGIFGGGAARPPAGPQTELVPQLLERVSRMEEELRSVRGRAEQSEFRERQLRERLEKLEGDIDFRLQQIEGQRGGAAPAARPAAPAATPPAATPPAAAPAAAGPRPPQRALAEGQAALARRDFGAAESAAREVIASRDAPRQADAQMLLGDALLGRRDFGAAAVAYDDAFRRAPQGSRAPEAMLGVANALIGLNNNRDACAQLNDLRSRNPNLSGALAERAADARRRAQCR
jgi:TolA-binding protein